MRVLLDMKLSPRLCPCLHAAGHEALHWSAVGDPRASDDVVAKYARENDLVIVTHDLDFGAILGTTLYARPSVVQVRTQDVVSDKFVSTILEQSA